MQIKISFLLLVMSTLLAGCEQTNTEINSLEGKSAQLSSTAFIARTNTLAYQLTSQASQQARELDNKIQIFLLQPDEQQLNALKTTWLNSYHQFLQSISFSYINVQDSTQLKRQHLDYRSLVLSLDAWPIAGGYIDYVNGYPFSGIVNDLTLEMLEPAVRLQHGFADPSYASTGFHPLAFMIWGENNQRQVSDYFLQENTRELEIASEGVIDDNSELNNSALDIKTEIAKSNAESQEQQEQAELTSEQAELPLATFTPQNNKRRREYLQMLSSMVIDDLERIQRRWEPSKGYYSQLLQANQNDTALAAILDAIENVLTRELIVKRLAVTEEHFAASSRQDAYAILSGLNKWLINEEETNAIVTDDFISLIKQADSQLADKFLIQFNRTLHCYKLMISQQVLSKELTAENFEACKKATNDLLALLKQAKERLLNFNQEHYRVGKTRMNNDFK